MRWSGLQPPTCPWRSTTMRRPNMAVISQSQWHSKVGKLWYSMGFWDTAAPTQVLDQLTWFVFFFLPHVCLWLCISGRWNALNISLCDHLSVSACRHSAFSQEHQISAQMLRIQIATHCDIHLERKITLLASGVEMLVILRIQDDEINCVLTIKLRNSLTYRVFKACPPKNRYHAGKWFMGSDKGLLIMGQIGNRLARYLAPSTSILHVFLLFWGHLWTFFDFLNLSCVVLVMPRVDFNSARTEGGSSDSFTTGRWPAYSFIWNW